MLSFATVNLSLLKKTSKSEDITRNLVYQKKLCNKNLFVVIGISLQIGENEFVLCRLVLKLTNEDRNSTVTISRGAICKYQNIFFYFPSLILANSSF